MLATCPRNQALFLTDERPLHLKQVRYRCLLINSGSHHGCFGTVLERQRTAVATGVVSLERQTRTFTRGMNEQHDNARP